MAAFVKVTKVQNGGGASASASVSSTASNALFSVGADFGDFSSAPTYTVSGGGTWTSDGTAKSAGTTSNSSVGMASCPSATGGAQTITCTFSAAAFGTTNWVYEFSGMASSSIRDVIGTGNTGTVSPESTESLTNTNANDVMLAVSSDQTSPPTTYGSPSNSWTTPSGGTETDGSTQTTGASAYKIVSASASQSTSITINSSATWEMLIAGYKQASGAAQDTPELRGRPYGLRGAGLMSQLIAQ